MPRDPKCEKRPADLIGAGIKGGKFACGPISLCSKSETNPLRPPRQQTGHAGCRTLIESAVKAFQSKSLDQFEIAGDNIAVSSGPAVSLSMVIHELCTNAVKHGALSAPNGRVSISWTVSEDHPPRFKLHWKERGGPPLPEPSRNSFRP